jgi:hypothetical protein
MTFPKYVPALVAALAAAPAIASVPTVAVPMRHIQQFVGTTQTLYVESRGNWYQAKMASPCWKLPDANRVRVEMGANDRFDGTSTVIVRREVCPVASVTSTVGPPLQLLLNPNG